MKPGAPCRYLAFLLLYTNQVVSLAEALTLPLADVPGTGALLLVRNETAFVRHYVAELLTAEGWGKEVAKKRTSC